MKKSCKKKGDTTKTKKPTMKAAKPKKKSVSRGDGGGRHSPFFR